MQVRLFAMMTVGLSALVAGCGTMNFGDGGERRAPAPAPLTAAPAGSVSAMPLPPPGSGPGLGAPPSGLSALGSAPAAPGAPIVPAATGAGAGIARPDLIGSWTISAAGDTCQLTMVLTTWTGGYRASTRNCTSVALKGISAWNLEGQQVQLFDNGGATVARLYATTKTQFNGSTTGGGPVSVSR